MSLPFRLTKNMLLFGGTAAWGLLLISCVTVDRAVLAPPKIAGATYVGSKDCAQCHSDKTDHFASASHARLALTDAKVGDTGCEACHGPGSLHTTSAAKTIDRIVDVFPAEEKAMVRSMLSESLQAVISQTLLKKIGGGRVAAHEIMIGTPAIRNLIREDKVAQMYSAIQTGGSLGMQTLDMCLKGLVAKGLVSRESAREKAKSPENF